jgi:antitoxin MazE
VGNSKGIRIPKTLLRRYGFVDHVDLRVTPQGLLIAPVQSVRAGWEESIVHAPPTDGLEDWRALPATFDETEWTWPTG